MRRSRLVLADLSAASTATALRPAGGVAGLFAFCFCVLLVTNRNTPTPYIYP